MTAVRLETRGDVADAQRTLDGLLREGCRIEVVNGEIEVTPGAAWSSHGTVLLELGAWLNGRIAQDPDMAEAKCRVTAEADVSADPSGMVREPYWRPDLCVVGGWADAGRDWLIGREVLLAVEIVSPSNASPTVDAYLERKARQCAVVDIPWMLGVEQNRITWWVAGMQVGHGPSAVDGLAISDWVITS